MKTMSRSLQMLNVARLNVKALKNQSEVEERDVLERAAKRCSSRNKPTDTNATSQCFSQSSTGDMECLAVLME